MIDIIIVSAGTLDYCLLTSFPVAAVITDNKVANDSMELGKYDGVYCQVYNTNFIIN